MFWRFGGYANISSIDSILDKPDRTLEEVLDENDVEQELKSQNAKLIEFLRDDVVLGQLLRYVTAPKPTMPASPPTDEEKAKSPTFFGSSTSKSRSKSRAGSESNISDREDKWRRYSFVSTQLLSTDTWSIVEALTENTDLLREFWGFIKSDPQLDNTQAGYFTKVNETLLDRRASEMVAFFQSLDGVVDNMIKHVDCPVIMDLLLKIISLEKEQSPGIVDWLQTQDLVPKLLTYITPEHPASVQTAAGDFLKAIITISANATGQDTTVIGPNELTRQLVSQTCIDRLLGEMLKGGNPLTVGVGIIIEVIRKNNSDYDADTQIGPVPKSSDPIYLGTLLRTFALHIKDFMELILSPSHTIVTEKGSHKVERKELPTAWGAKIEPLGFDRFKTCELMAELLHCSNMTLLNEKGSEAEVRQRDADRARLKAEGKLASDHPRQESADFGVSVDSQGFHHAEAFSPLGESPETVRPSDVPSSGLEEDFEKVNLSEVEPEISTERGLGRPEEETSSSTGTANLSSPALSDTSTPTLSTEPHKRRSSLLTEQLHSEKEKSLGPRTESTTDAEASTEVAKPAPLFSKKPADDASALARDDDDGAEESKITHEETGEQDEPNPGLQTETDGTPVVGDLLKVNFVEHDVVPTIIDFFFRFPWNNFLHNVVYDVVQQVFNGRMDQGYNRNLAVDVFETGRVTDRIVEGQRRSDQAQQEKKMRLGYMGHLTLIAEEVVKFTERQPPEQLAQLVLNKITDQAWISFVEHTLTETRERDNAILGGVRPDSTVGPRQAVLNAVNAAQGGYATGSNALANAGLTDNNGGGLDSLDLTNAGAAGYGLNSSSGHSNALMSGFGSEDDDDDDDDMEEGELAGNAAEDIRRQQRRHIADEEQSSAYTSEPSSDAPPIPAPLSIAPSRARQRLAARLAQRQNLGAGAAGAAMSAAAHELERDPAVATPSSAAVARSPPNTPTLSDIWGSLDGEPAGSEPLMRSPDHSGGGGGGGSAFPDVEADGDDAGQGFEDDFTGFEDVRRAGGAGVLGESDDEEASDEADDDDDDDDDENGEEQPPKRIQRQTTTEAVERRPLDDGDDSDDSDETDPSPAGGGGAAAAASSLQVRAQTQTRDSMDAKTVEQEKLLERWGFRQREKEQERERQENAGSSSSDEEDEPMMSLGSKYLARRRTGS